jgi:asparagine synthase (glutamine-hydrolysing)
MSGTVGEFLVLIGNLPQAGAHRLNDAKRWAPWPSASAEVQYATPAPGVHVWSRGDVYVHSSSAAGGVGVGIEPPGLSQPGVDSRAAVVDEWERTRQWSPLGQRGRFAYVLWDTAGPRVLAFTDAFRSCALHYAQTQHGFVVASDLRLILAAGLVEPRVSPSAVYHYLNFSYVPAPFSAIEGVAKLGAGHRLEWSSGRTTLSKYWDAVYPADLGGAESERADQLRDRIVETVKSYGNKSAGGWGTFLSGGTDSSSIAGILSSAQTTPVHSFSIGFSEEGYDELSYSAIAAQHYGLQSHQRRVSERDAVDVIGRLTSAYDEPYGNSSAIPTFYCAQLAASQSVSLLVAGDGGDEIFGGNERYAKDQIFERYYRAPAIVRGLGSAASKMLQGLDLRFANRVKNFVHRASLPNPDRFYSDDSFASDHYDDLLSGAFRARVGRDDSLDVQRGIFREAQANCDLHRLMYLDLKMTIADNDVVKVVRASKLAGVQVVFPYLDRDLVDFTGRLAGTDKVRGLNKRHLFKIAAQDILPEAIRKKKKQGFGLPVSVWLRRGGAFRDMARDVVLSDRAISRGYFEPGFVRQLMERHERGAWDHASEIYLLLMLELWHREHVDAQD